MKTVLNVGCGNSEIDQRFFPAKEWKEVRLDIDPDVKPDIVASNMDLGRIGPYDAVYNSHNIEHVFAHEVAVVLDEFFRVLKPGGRVLVTCPDLEPVATAIAKGNLEGVLYDSPTGPISAIDIVYGHRGFIAAGNEFYAHKTGFTRRTMAEKLKTAGFVNVKVTSGSDDLALWAHGFKPKKENKR